jgi:hypothetical protein
MADLPAGDDAEALRELAGQCRKLAGGGSTPEVRRCFAEMATEYERKARAREVPPRRQAQERIGESDKA